MIHALIAVDEASFKMMRHKKPPFALSGPELFAIVAYCYDLNLLRRAPEGMSFGADLPRGARYMQVKKAVARSGGTEPLRVLHAPGFHHLSVPRQRLFGRVNGAPRHFLRAALEKLRVDKCTLYCATNGRA